jgi:hypothetical protein
MEFHGWVKILDMKKDTKAQVRHQLSLLAKKQSAAAEKFQSLVSDKNATPADIETLAREQGRLASRQAQLMTTLKVLHLEAPDQFGAYDVAAAQRPLREQILDVVEAIGVPASPRLLSQFAAIRYGLSLPIARFSSLRRDEERGYQKDPTSRPAWVVPAINAFGLVAMPRIVASSAWKPESRIIGPRTLRVNHLRSLLSVLDASNELSKIDEHRFEQLVTFVFRYSHSVIGTPAPGDAPSADHIREAAQAELARIEPADLEERLAAAAKLERLPGAMQFWGRPSVISDAAGRIGGHPA